MAKTTKLFMMFKLYRRKRLQLTFSFMAIFEIYYGMNSSRKQTQFHVKELFFEMFC